MSLIQRKAMITKKGSRGGSTGGSLFGGILGAIGGGLAGLAGGPAGIAAGAAAGSSLGMGLGGAVGETVDPAKAGSISDNSTPITNNAQRHFPQNMEPSPENSQTLMSAIKALSTMPNEYQAQYGRPLIDAYVTNEAMLKGIA